MSNGILQSTTITQTLANFYISLHSYWSSTVLLTSAPTWFDTMMTNKALLCELTATLRQMDWNNTKTAWKTSHVKAKQLYQNIRPFWWRSYYSAFRYTFDGFHFMQNQIKPKILPPVRLCILIIISILGHLALKLHNSASKTRMPSVTKHLQEMH